MAPADQIYPGFIQGGESVRIVGMHPDGDFHFQLPYVKLSNRIVFQDNEISSAFNIETLAFYPNQKQLTMTWRAAVPCDKKLLKVNEIAINLSR